MIDEKFKDLIDYIEKSPHNGTAGVTLPRGLRKYLSKEISELMPLIEKYPFILHNPNNWRYFKNNNQFMIKHSYGYDHLYEYPFLAVYISISEIVKIANSRRPLFILDLLGF